MTELLQYSFFQHALLGSLLTAVACGIVGTYIVARRLVFISGGITHASFGGLGIAVYMGANPIAGAMVFAVLSAVFAALTSILAKVGVEGVESNLATALRTGVVLVMAWAIVLARGKQRQLRGIDRREAAFIALSGVATGASWLCYYYAIQNGPVSVVVPIDKLSILVTVAFSALVLRERLGRRELGGLTLLVAGTLAIAAA